MDLTENKLSEYTKVEEKVKGPDLPSIYSFLDYRDFLKAYYVARKSIDQKFSIRMFSRLCSMKAGNHIKLIMDGDRNLTRNHALDVAKACKLDRKQTDYFLHLIEFKHAKTEKARSLHFQKIQNLAPKGKIHILNQTQLLILSKWYILPLLEMVNLEGFTYDPRAISKRFYNQIGAGEVEKAYTLLQKIGLIDIKDGKIVRTEKSLFFGSDTPNELVQHFHQQMIPQAIPTLNKVDPSNRHFAATTITISPSDIPRLKQRIDEFQKEFLHEGDANTNSTELYQFNIQFFPLIRGSR